MKDKFLIPLVILLTVLVNSFLYLDDLNPYIFYPHENCTKTTAFGAVYMYFLHFNNWFIMPFVFYWAGKLFKLSYLEFETRYLSSAPVFFIYALAILIPLTFGMVFEPNTCPSPELTVFGKFFLATYTTLFFTSITVGILVFVNRLLYLIEHYYDKVVGDIGSNDKK